MRAIIKSILLTSSLLLSGLCYGQDTLLFEKVIADSAKDVTFGPNRTHYVHAYMAYGIAAGPEFKGAEIHQLRSPQITLGARYKLRVWEYYHTGFNLSYQYQGFRMVQNNTTKIPSPTVYNKSRIYAHNASLEWYHRINFKKTGNSMAPHIDLGGYIGYFFSRGHYAMQKPNTPGVGNPRKVISKSRGVDYGLPINYGVRGRFSGSKVAVYGEYRLSKFFDSSLSYPDLAPFVIGVEYGLY